MFPGARTKGTRVTGTAGVKNAIKTGPGTVVTVAYTGVGACRIDFYDALTATGSPVFSIEGTNTSIPVVLNPFLGFETGLSINIVTTLSSAFLSLVIE